MKRPDIDVIAKKLIPICNNCDGCSDCAGVRALLTYIRELEAANKRIEQETAFKCAYLAWQAGLLKIKPQCAICHKYELNLDSLYSTTWKELNK